MEVKNLDQALVEIVEKIMSGDMLPGVEQMNPIQALIAQFLAKKIDEMPRDLAVVTNVTPEKDEKGQFVKQSTE